MKYLILIGLMTIAAACAPETANTESANTTTTVTVATSTAPAAAGYDLQFIDTMTKHHQMAISMGEMAGQSATDAKVKEFGRMVVDDQKKDIARLAAWRSEWYASAPDAHNMQLPGASSMDMDMGHMQTMKGHDFDMMFVEMMIPHHKGALEMSRDALQKSVRPEIKAFAQETIDKQLKEIGAMEDWKKSRGKMGEMTMPAGTSSELNTDPLLSRMAPPIQRVESKKVCMITERVFVNDQIPVPVKGKTYYGCCDMCKTALAQDEAKRTAIDPVSKRQVDKAVAVIGADKKGRVYYFENEANLRAFTPSES